RRTLRSPAPARGDFGVWTGTILATAGKSKEKIANESPSMVCSLRQMALPVLGTIVLAALAAASGEKLDKDSQRWAERMRLFFLPGGGRGFSRVARPGGAKGVRAAFVGPPRSHAGDAGERAAGCGRPGLEGRGRPLFRGRHVGIRDGVRRGARAPRRADRSGEA